MSNADKSTGVQGIQTAIDRNLEIETPMEGASNFGCGSYGRGVGKILSSCPAGREKDGLLCYDFCKKGYHGVGSVCWETCPNDYKDIGAFCHKPWITKKSYGRGVGVPMSCGEGEEKDGLLCYEPCKEGYNGVGPVCWKKQGGGSYGRGVGKILSSCPAGREKDGLLCYKFCKEGYHGVGPVCWENCPEDYKDIGAFCDASFAKKSYGRGVGVPMSCAEGEEKDGLLCYEKCKEGYNGVGPVCWKTQCGSSTTAEDDVNSSMSTSIRIQHVLFGGIFIGGTIFSVFAHLKWKNQQSHQYYEQIFNEK